VAAAGNSPAWVADMQQHPMHALAQATWMLKTNGTIIINGFVCADCG
jgi:hypothetical protein